MQDVVLIGHFTVEGIERDGDRPGRHPERYEIKSSRNSMATAGDSTPA